MHLPSLPCFPSLHWFFCTCHRSVFSTGKCIFCAWFVMDVTSLVEMSISPAAFSGFWVPRGENEWGYQPAAPGSLPREFSEHLQKGTSVPLSRRYVLVPSLFPAFSFIKDDPGRGHLIIH